MHIIIDGYNVLKQALSSKMITDSQRRAFINMLGKYGQKKNHHIVVVFDGGPDAWPSQEKDHGIVIAYSGIKQSADDLIKKALLQKPNVLLVTSDNELKKAAQHGTMIMDSLEFYALVKQERMHKEKPAQGTLHKTSKEENPLIDDLMRKDSQAIYKGEEEERKERRSKSQTLSKKERAYLQKLKKL